MYSLTTAQTRSVHISCYFKSPVHWIKLYFTNHSSLLANLYGPSSGVYQLAVLADRIEEETEEDLCSSNHFILDRIAEKGSTHNLFRCVLTQKCTCPGRHYIERFLYLDQHCLVGYLPGQALPAKIPDLMGDTLISTSICYISSDHQLPNVEYKVCA
jgi:hypothetical protein